MNLTLTLLLTIQSKASFEASPPAISSLGLGLGLGLGLRLGLANPNPNPNPNPNLAELVRRVPLALMVERVDCELARAELVAAEEREALGCVVRAVGT